MCHIDNAVRVVAKRGLDIKNFLKGEAVFSMIFGSSSPPCRVDLQGQRRGRQHGRLPLAIGSESEWLATWRWVCCGGLPWRLAWRQRSSFLRLRSTV